MYIYIYTHIHISIYLSLYNITKSPAWRSNVAATGPGRAHPNR